MILFFVLMPQPFFVLHKSSSQKPGRKLAGKTRRRIELSSSFRETLEKSETEAAEGLEYNDQLFENLRMEAFDHVWSKTESTIKVNVPFQFYSFLGCNFLSESQLFQFWKK